MLKTYCDYCCAYALLIIILPAFCAEQRSPRSALVAHLATVRKAASELDHKLLTADDVKKQLELKSNISWKFQQIPLEQLPPSLRELREHLNRAQQDFDEQDEDCDLDSDYCFVCSQSRDKLQTVHRAIIDQVSKIDLSAFKSSKS